MLTLIFFLHFLDRRILGISFQYISGRELGEEILPSMSFFRVKLVDAIGSKCLSECLGDFRQGEYMVHICFIYGSYMVYLLIIQKMLTMFAWSKPRLWDPDDLTSLQMAPI